MKELRAPGEITHGAEPSAARSALRRALARWLRVPAEPPAVPPGRHSWARSFRPAEAYLRYLKFQYLMVVGIVGVLMVPLVAGILWAMMADGLVIASTLIVFLFVLPGLVCVVAGYWALQLQFDHTWYVMTDRAIRIRTGIWVIRELTVTFENAQNVKVRRGPVQRWLGIGDVAVETAAAGPAGEEGTASSAIVRGVEDPPGIRDRVVERMRHSRTAGLGDGAEPGSRSGAGLARQGSWSPAHLQALREIREAAARL